MGFPNYKLQNACITARSFEKVYGRKKKGTGGGQLPVPVSLLNYEKTYFRWVKYSYIEILHIKRIR